MGIIGLIYIVIMGPKAIFSINSIVPFSIALKKYSKGN